MPDHALLFEDLVSRPGLRARSYRVHELPSGWAAVDLTARQGPDWLFARRWVAVRNGHRLLYDILDAVEAAEFRFDVATRSIPPIGAPEGVPSTSARQLWDGLNAEEQRIHAELFPDEHRLIEQGYDWTDRDVLLHGVPLPRDALGRIREEAEGVEWEWVVVPEDATWRRYPLRRLSSSPRADEPHPLGVGRP